jgi:hypothetical protein
VGIRSRFVGLPVRLLCAVAGLARGRRCPCVLGGRRRVGDVLGDGGDGRRARGRGKLQGEHDGSVSMRGGARKGRRRMSAAISISRVCSVRQGQETVVTVSGSEDKRSAKYQLFNETKDSCA